MEKVKLGNSDVEITPIVFGAWAIGGWMWGGAEEKDAIEAIHASLDRGITTLDTAPVYGFGRSEQLVAKALQGKSRDKIQLLTKFGLRWDTDKGEYYFDSEMNDGKPVRIHRYAGKKSIIKECEESLTRLKTDYIDLYQIHWPDATTPIEESFEAVAQLKKEGKIREAGVCNYSADQMKAAEKVLPLASNQMPYSMVHRDIEKDVAPYCQESKKGILAYSPLQRGLLTGKITADYQFDSGDHRPGTKYFKQPNRDAINAFLQEIRPIADGYNVTLAQLAINWTIQQPGITAALVGARNAAQVQQNAGGLSFELRDDEVRQITGLLDQLTLV